MIKSLVTLAVALLMLSLTAHCQDADGIVIKGNTFEAPLPYLYKVRNMKKELDGCKAELKSNEATITTMVNQSNDMTTKFNTLGTDFYTYKTNTEANYTIIKGLVGGNTMTEWSNSIISINKNRVALRKGLIVVSVAVPIVGYIAYKYGQSRTN